MFGEDASGRKVSLLNDSGDTSTSISTTHPRSAPFVRPTLPHRAKDTALVSSFSQRSREGSNKSASSRSSISCSPRHSPPTPPLVRLDSRSSIHTLKTPSPMTPHYNFDPLDHHDFKQQQGNLPYYNPGYSPYDGGDDANPYPPMHNPNQHPYYPGMTAQQPLPPVYGHMGHAYPLQPNLHFQPTGPVPYPPSHLQDPLSPPSSQQSLSSNPPLQSTLQSHQPPVPIAKTHKEHTSAPSTTPSAVSSVKADPPPPITVKTSSSSNNANAASKSINSSKSTANSAIASPATPTSSGPKKKYPCPHSKEYKCTDTFTTSGHAARHGKKHTGEKNVNCPTCGKAFTRKDNMKQHERTHKPGHGSRSAAGAGGSSPGKSPTIGVGSGHSSNPKKRTMSGSTMASLASPSSVIAAGSLTMNPHNAAGIEDDDDDDDDEDADGDADMDINMDADVNLVPPHQLQESDLSMLGRLTHPATSTQTQTMVKKPKKELGQRPSMGKSKLSEILEQVNTASRTAGGTDHHDTEMGSTADLDGEADGEGESPGLDALATVAAGEMEAQLGLRR